MYLLLPATTTIIIKVNWDSGNDWLVRCVQYMYDHLVTILRLLHDRVHQCVTINQFGSRYDKLMPD